MGHEVTLHGPGKYVDSNGRRRFQGRKKELKSTQSLTSTKSK